MAGRGALDRLRADVRRRAARTPRSRWSSWGRARWRAPTARRSWPPPGRWRASRDAGGRLARVQRAAHRRRPGRRARSRLRAGPGGKALDAMLGGGVDRCGCWAPTSSTPAHRRRHVRGLPGPSRRPRRRARRRDPAGRGLHRKARHLCQHRGPGAARLRAPRSRRATRARTGRSCARSAPDRPDAAVRHDRGAARRGWSRSTRCSADVGFLPRFGASDTCRPGRRCGGVSDAPFVPAFRTTTRPTRSAAPARPWRRASRRSAAVGSPAPMAAE